MMRIPLAVTSESQAAAAGKVAAARALMQANSSAQLSNLFANLRNNQADLLATLVVTPQLTQAPGISPQGHLQLAGVFPTRPQQIAFQIVYQPINGPGRVITILARPRAPQVGLARVSHHG